MWALCLDARMLILTIQPILSLLLRSDCFDMPFSGLPLPKWKGFDLASAYDTTVPARGRAVVKTGLAIAIPENTYARIAPRSGLAVKKFIDTGAGVVDYDYRGEVGVVLFNHADEDFDVKKGDRVAQLILERISMADVVETDELFATERGAAGFGSTGVAEKKPKIAE